MASWIRRMGTRPTMMGALTGSEEGVGKDSIKSSSALLKDAVKVIRERSICELADRHIADL